MMQNETMLSLIILAGGRSSRMGRDKASLPWQNTNLLTDLIRRSHAVGFHEIIISANAQPDISHLSPSSKAAIRIVADHYPNSGPLGGMEAAFSACTCPYCVVVSVDLPFYDFSPISALLPILTASPSVDAVIPMVEGRCQPLAALYRRKTVLNAVRRALDHHEYRVLSIANQLAVRYVSVTEKTILYENINTPSAYKDALAININRQRAVPVVSISSSQSGDGKTTLATQIISELSRRGYAVGYIKSTHHRHCREKKDSDTDKACKTGAVQALLCGPDDISASLSKRQVIEKCSQQIKADLVIIESRSTCLFPVIYIDSPMEPPISANMITAAISSRPISSCRVFRPGQIEDLCSYILYVTQS